MIGVPNAFATTIAGNNTLAPIGYIQRLTFLEQYPTYAVAFNIEIIPLIIRNFFPERVRTSTTQIFFTFPLLWIDGP